MKLNKRQTQAYNTRKKIVDVALTAFDEIGYDNLTIRHICDRADVSIGNFYHYFKTKEDIIDEVYNTFDFYLMQASNDFQEGYDTCMYLIFEQMKQIEEKGYRVVSQLFSMQLNAGTKYILNKDRYFYRELYRNMQIAVDKKEIISELTSEEMVDRLLRIVRGGIYDWCLHEGSYNMSKTIKGDLLAYLIK